MGETSSAQKSAKKVSPEGSYQLSQMLPMDQVTRQRMSTELGNMDRISLTLTSTFKREWDKL